MLMVELWRWLCYRLLPLPLSALRDYILQHAPQIGRLRTSRDGLNPRGIANQLYICALRVSSSRRNLEHYCVILLVYSNDCRNNS
jgi:hypothetical protein